MSTRPLLVVLFALIGGAAGWSVASSGLFATSAKELTLPEPYLVPKQPGGLSLSLAMVHDVLHERYVRPGKAYYAERARRLQTELPVAGEEPADNLAPTIAGLNDLAVAQFYLGETVESLATLDRKQLLQSELDKAWQRDKADQSTDRSGASWVTGQADRLELYRTYANRGTFLILDALRAGLRENPAAQDELAKGTEIIREAVAMNGDSHFGREPWQLVILEFLQAVCREPELLLEFDMLGQRLDGEVLAGRAPHVTGWPERWQTLSLNENAWNSLLGSTADEKEQLIRGEIRENWITRVGAEPGWNENVPSIHRQPIPFDEPTLAIVGMWMIGGGPNPHFALAIGGAMERIGELELAWQAYQRAELMAGHVWPVESIQRGFIEHCQRRREKLEAMLAAEKPNTEASEIRASLKRNFDEELARGQKYQEAYHAFESERVAGGHAPGSDDFYKPFYESSGQIASDSEGYDVVRIVRKDSGLADQLSAMLLGAGVLALPAAILLGRRTSVA
jgi:hypothetical protein